MEFLRADITRKEHIISFLNEFSSAFPVPLTEKVSIEQYVNKVLEKGYVIIAVENEGIAGINMFYANDREKKRACISLICVSDKYRRRKVATSLLQIAEDISLENGMNYLLLCVHKENLGAIRTYEKFGFIRNDSLTANEEYNITYEKKISGDLL